VVLILEILGREATQLGSASRKVFGADGGLIGRDSRSSWVLPATKVSGRHARISYQNGVFYIEDTSTNGVFINASKSRLGKGRPYALKSGDSIYIEPYTIAVSISSSAYDAHDEPPRQRVSPPPRRPSEPHYDPFNLNDPFGEQAVPFLDQVVPSAHDPHGEPLSGQEVDPLKLLGGADPSHRPAAPSRKPPSAQDLERASPLQAYYKPPAVIGRETPPGSTPPPPEPADPFAIPADYDPLAPNTSFREVRRDIAPSPPMPPTPPTPARPTPPTRPTPPNLDDDREPVDEHGPSPVAELDLSMFESPAVPQPPASPTPPPVAPPPPIETRPVKPAPTPVPPPPAANDPVAPIGEGLSIDLRAVLSGAGLDPEDITPDLARNFGEILRVVVAGVMEVLQARQSVKDEFRMRMTQFRPADNNPLKFSANVDDALHNLLVKRNAAYLKPVEAFDDAFADLRHHQLAMLAGMRTAFETLLNEFQPDRLQEQYDRQMKRGSLLNVAPKLRYWDLYRDMYEALMKDPEATFRKLFGDAFAKAYEEQLSRLKTQSGRPTPPNRRQEPG
jgi:type VI secretion system FHA domain protein